MAPAVDYFSPPVCDDSAVVGFCVTDSFSYYQTSHGWANYLPDMVWQFYLQGVLLYGAARDGAYLSAGHYSELVRELQLRSGRAPAFVLIIAMGNDLLRRPSYPCRVWDDYAHLRGVAGALLQIPTIDADGADVGLIFAGSTETFGYRDLDCYDDAALAVLDMLPYNMFYFIDRLRDLGSLRTADAIGHIHERERWRVVRRLMSLAAELCALQFGA